MKKSFIKIIALLIALLSAFSLTACFGPVTAYEIAVENGFEGTEEEWLASLQGRDGESGKDGKDAQDITIEDIYIAAKNAGYTKSFLQFIEEYFSSSVEDYSTEIAVNKAILSTVEVVCTINANGQSGKAFGSGVIYSIDKEKGNALVLTNYHVVYNSYSNKIANEINLFLYGSKVVGMEIPATYVGGSMSYDIAVLKIENSEVLKNSNATAVTIAEGNSVKVGSTAIAIGNSASQGISATKGIVSVDSEYVRMLGADESTIITFRSIRIDAAVNPGNSGCGVFNANGEMLGIVNAKTIDEGIENMAYAIPASLAVAVADNIIWNVSGGKTGVSKALMGIEVVAKESKAVYNESTQSVEIVEKVEISKITAGSLASGVLQVGDILVSLTHNGKVTNCNRMYAVVDYMINVRPNEQVILKYIRNGEERVATFTLTSEHFTNIV